MRLTEYAALLALVLVLAVAAITTVGRETTRKVTHALEQTLGTYKPESGEIKSK